MQFKSLLDQSAQLLQTTDVVEAGAAYRKQVFDRAQTNGIMIGAVIMDAVAIAASTAENPQQLAAVTALVNEAVATVMARRLEMFAARETGDLPPPNATVH